MASNGRALLRLTSALQRTSPFSLEAASGVAWWSARIPYAHQQLDHQPGVQWQAPPAASPVALAAWHRCMAVQGSACFSTSAIQQQQQQVEQVEQRRASSSQASTSTTSGSSQAAQPLPASWVERHLPAAALPYAQLMRLEKPIGTWLLLWPGLWSIALAAPAGQLPDLWLSSLFGLGAVLLRGAGCTINDLWDRDIDRKVKRTRSRPLARGAVTPTQAVALLGGTLSLGLLILLQLNDYTKLLGASSLLLVGTYPLMKRITNWPQAFLGLTFNWGALMGYSAAAGACDWSVVLPLYAAGVNWTLVYDTIYAHQDKKDDAAVGVKSTALHFGDNTKRWLSGFAALQTACLAATGLAAGCGAPFYAAVAAGAGHQAWQIARVDLDNGPDCMVKFVSNKWYGAILYGGIVMDRLLAVAAPAAAVVL